MSLNLITACDLYNAPLTDYNYPIVDVRTVGEYEHSHIPTALVAKKHTSLEDLYAEIMDMGYEVSCKVVVYGRDDTDGTFEDIIAFFLRENFDVFKLDGGLEAFSRQFPGILDPALDSSQLILPAFIPLVNVYLGSAVCANLSTLRSLGVKSIVNAGASEAVSEDLTSNFNYLLMDIIDSPTQALEPHLSEALAFITLHAPAGPVFVHCSQGISRSVSVVIALLVAQKGMGYNEALEYVQCCRRIARPNIGFVRQLQAFQSAQRTRVLEDSNEQ